MVFKRSRKYQQVALLISLLLLLVIMGAGCNNKNNAAPTTSNNGGAEQNAAVTITDSLNRTITLTSTPQKIISLSPAITEILFAIGAKDQISGVTKYCDYPQEALSKPQIGDFENPNLELIINLKPDLVCTAAGIQQDFVKQLEDLNIKVVTLDANNINQVLDNITLAGLITGQNKNAEQLVLNLTTRMKRIEAIIDKRATTKPTVFFEVWDEPLMTAGPDSFIDDLITMAGGINIAGDAPKRFANYNLEILIQKDPDLYIINSHAHDPADIQKRPGFAGLKAVQNHQVYTIEDDLVTLPGPRLIDGLEQMAHIIQPDLF